MPVRVPASQLRFRASPSGVSSEKRRCPSPNAGEVTYNHRVSAGATLHVTYTYSKSMAQGGYTDLVNRVVTRQISGSDNPHRITVSGIYQLPVGRGRSHFSGMNRFLDFAVGGWQVG